MKKTLFLLLLLPYQIFAQQFVKDLQTQLDAYYQSFMPLKLHVFTNQPEYAPGDTVYFKVNLVAAQSNHPVRGKSILSAALLNTAGEKIQINGFSIMEGKGNNQIVLPATLPHGDYYLTVWSDWMNDNNSLTYKKLISVGTTPNVPAPNRKLSASPEGGQLIDGLNNKVIAFGQPLSQLRVNENGTQILQLNTGTDGTSSFYITPRTGFHYEIVSADGRVSLPQVKADGVALLATLLPSKNSMRVYLTANERSDYRNRILHLIVSMQGVIYQSTDIVFKNQSFFSLEVPFQKLPQGIAQVTLLDDERNVIVERLIYVPETQSVLTSLNLPKKQFKTRERIDLRIKTTDGLSPVKSTLALTTFNTSLMPLDTLNRHSLQTDLRLLSDLGFDNVISAHDNPETIDHKLVLAKWSRFDWKTLSKRSDNVYYSQYMHFKGKAFDIETNQPVRDSTKITFFMHKNVNTYQTYTNANGEFTLSMLFEFYETDEVYYRVEQKGKLLPGARVQINESRVVPHDNASSEKRVTGYNILFDKRKTINESYAYHTKASRSFVPPEVQPLIEEEIFGPDITIKMEDYHLFPTMIETLREVVPFSQHRKVRGNDVVRVFNPDTDLYWEDDPVYVIDGVMTDDTGYFLSLNPADIAAIKVVYSYDKLRTFGTIGSGGMFIVDTKIPGNNKNVHRSVRSLTLNGLNEPLTKGEVSHEVNPGSRIPDLRTNLAWLPSLETDANGEASISFYASDVPGKYRIEGEGITRDGRLFSFDEEFEIVFQRNPD